MANYQINSTGNVIIAEQQFMDENYPNDYTLIPDIPIQIVPPEWTWYIDIGPFMDRFGSAKMMVLVSQDITVQAIIKDMMARKWIDLKRADVEQSLIYIGSKVPALSAQMRSDILNTPVSDAENMVLKKLYFNA